MTFRSSLLYKLSQTLQYSVHMQFSSRKTLQSAHYKALPRYTATPSESTNLQSEQGKYTAAED